ncbi:branched-chain amino acid ABC transporter (LivH) [Actinocatenispora thailandica]|uniref:Branched-chain amino acid ABC transporter (LivH) n=1 Tax=Actinocatenispora thailandica TaxID=227318 RepID=A0A7R7DNZ8_9ACTN|nr:branched-chain amino acid ABC transporter permease [Actinocatenispora thailandica]BCJ35026.1 branched-chain amino acid ABC transporter (LivH) [Actinocatenispora thailandica]
MNFHFLFSNIGDLTVTGLSQGAIYALIALGYTLVYGLLKLINFAHSEVFMMGTFGALVAWNLVGLHENDPTPSLPMMVVYLLVGLVGAMVWSGVTALTVEFVAYRPLRRRNAPRLVFLITAIGASVAISEAVGVITSRNQYGMPDLFKTTNLITIGNVHITNVDLGVVVAAVVMMVVLDQFINRTRLGRGIRAVAQDPDTAALMGINKNRVIVLTFALGGVMAGAAALLYNLKIGVTRADIGFLLGIKAFTAAVLGGIGNLRGALLGGLALGLVENYGSALFGTSWRDVVAFVVLVVILMFRPTGLLGESLGKARA